MIRSIAKQLVGICISVMLGLVFLYSGYSKLFPIIEPFEFTFVDIHLANWYTAPILARLVIAAEFFLGVLLVACFSLRRFTIPVSVGLLSFFTLYLAVQIIVSGNNGNCGCFGEHLRMTPLAGIIKNLVLIVASIVPFYLHAGWTIARYRLVLLLIAPVSIVIPFVVNPVDYSYTSNNLDEKTGYPLELDLLYHPEDSSKVEIPKAELRKGKQVLAFLSLTCSHCRIAAKKMRLIKKRDPNINIYFVLNGDRAMLPVFYSDTHSENIPASFCLGKTFVRLASSQLPRIYYLENGIVVKKVDYFELNQNDIEQWMSTGQLRR